MVNTLPIVIIYFAILIVIEYNFACDNSFSQERSSDMETACRSLLGMLGDLIEVGEEDMTNHVVLSDKASYQI